MSQKKTAGSSELRIRCDETLRRRLAEAARRSLRSMTPQLDAWRRLHAGVGVVLVEPPLAA
jgi:hypothetical protein